MTTLVNLVLRNCKVYFKDKGLFFSSLITPMILLILYCTFLGKVFKDSMLSAFPEGFTVDEKLINATVGGELISSLLAVSCVTVAFCTNLLMIKDKASKVRNDLTVAPVSPVTLAWSYFLGSMVASLIICYFALSLCFIYLAIVGWYLSFTDVLQLVSDVFILVLFGTSLSSLINTPLKTEGQASAVGTIISTGYGFICGAYMPISNFGKGLQNVLTFLPCTYGTSLVRNASLNGVYREMVRQGFPLEVIEGIKDSIDCNIYFFGNKVEIGVMYLIMVLTLVVLMALYVLINCVKIKRAKNK